MSTTMTKNPDEKFCCECGGVIKAKAELCVRCGCRQPGMYGSGNSLTATTPNGKSQLVAALLFLGGIGVHKFYLGRIGWGIVYLLFCWTFIPTIIALIEGIVYVAMSADSFAAKYGHA